METKKFKCKDEVIYRRTDEKSEWTYGIFSHYYDYNNVEGVVVDGHFLLSTVFDILSYEGNEHLVGTADSPDEEVRLEEGEWIIPADIIQVYEKVVNCIIRQFDYAEDDLFKCKNSTAWALAIRFSDFNPNDMEATKAKILCVKGGKIVRYRN